MMVTKKKASKKKTPAKKKLKAGEWEQQVNESVIDSYPDEQKKIGLRFEYRVVLDSQHDIPDFVFEMDKQTDFLSVSGGLVERVEFDE